jgi:LacI family transcriptional regulator
LRQRLLSGELKVGDRLDSERRLAERFQLRRGRVSKVIDGLCREGLVERRVGRGGTIVISNRPTSLQTGLKQIPCLLTHFRQFSPVDNYFYDIIHGAQDAAREAGFSLDLWSPARGPLGDASVLDDLPELHAEVAIVDEEFTDDFLAGLLRRGVWPIVLNRPPAVAADAILADNAAGASRAAEYLHGLGHRLIGYLGNLADPNHLEREAAFVDTTVRLGLDQAGSVFRLDVNTLDLARAGVRSSEIDMLVEARVEEVFLRDHTAVLCSNDYVAEAVYRRADGLELRIPEDLSVVGFCDFALAQQVSPRLTSVRIDSGRIGRWAVQMLLDRLADPIDPRRRQPEIRRVPVDLNVRDSCTRPAD